MKIIIFLTITIFVFQSCEYSNQKIETQKKYLPTTRVGCIGDSDTLWKFISTSEGKGKIDSWKALLEFTQELNPDDMLDIVEACLLIKNDGLKSILEVAGSKGPYLIRVTGTATIDFDNDDRSPLFIFITDEEESRYPMLGQSLKSSSDTVEIVLNRFLIKEKYKKTSDLLREVGLESLIISEQRFFLAILLQEYFHVMVNHGECIDAINVEELLSDAISISIGKEQFVVFRMLMFWESCDVIEDNSYLYLNNRYKDLILEQEISCEEIYDMKTCLKNHPKLLTQIVEGYMK
jgi:hypothetical protein